MLIIKRGNRFPHIQNVVAVCSSSSRLTLLSSMAIFSSLWNRVASSDTCATNGSSGLMDDLPLLHSMQQATRFSASSRPPSAEALHGQRSAECLCNGNSGMRSRLVLSTSNRNLLFTAISPPPFSCLFGIRLSVPAVRGWRRLSRWASAPSRPRWSWVCGGSRHANRCDGYHRCRYDGLILAIVRPQRQAVVQQEREQFERHPHEHRIGGHRPRFAAQPVRELAANPVVRS